MDWNLGFSCPEDFESAIFEHRFPKTTLNFWKIMFKKCTFKFIGIRNQNISHVFYDSVSMFCICFHWNCLEISILTIQNFPKTLGSVTRSWAFPFFYVFWDF